MIGQTIAHYEITSKLGEGTRLHYRALLSPRHLSLAVKDYYSQGLFRGDCFPWES